jgi:hypothetical protein
MTAWKSGTGMGVSLSLIRSAVPSPCCGGDLEFERDSNSLNHLATAREQALRGGVFAKGCSRGPRATGLLSSGAC